MAGTLPHAVFVETDLDDDGRSIAWAGELPGCAALAGDPAAAVAALPSRVATFVAWLRSRGEVVDEPMGNWYEVERASARPGGIAPRRAAFSLDDLSPSADEFATWQRWAELAREDLASALDRDPSAAAGLAWLAEQDVALASDLGAPGGQSLTAPPGEVTPDDSVARLYAARDALTAALVAAGPGGAGVRRALRLAIADDLRGVDIATAR